MITEITNDNYTTQEKLQILADAAKYDVACTSSGSSRRGKKGELGNAEACGICHSFAADGRCISLLKILMTNHCAYDCKYCINRASNDVRRATFTPQEICELTVEFYKRNYIEGLFLSSGVLKNPTYTMEKMCETLLLLRTRYHFNGYIHVKTIPGASDELLAAAGYLADRISVNLELPTETALRSLAPNKTMQNILNPMGKVQSTIASHRIAAGKSAYMDRSRGNQFLRNGIFSDNSKKTFREKLNMQNTDAKPGNNPPLKKEDPNLISRDKNKFTKHILTWENACQLAGRILSLPGYEGLPGLRRIPLEKLREAARSYDASITEYLSAVLIHVLLEKQRREHPHKERPVALAVPINLRSWFPSETVRNFITTVRPSIDPALGDYTFPEIVSQVRHYMKLHIHRQELQAAFTGNVRFTKNFFLRAVPVFLKNPVMALNYYLFGVRPYSCTYTNPGAFTVPPEMAPHIQGMEVVLGQATVPRCHCASISYGDIMEITFAGTQAETDTERDFFRFLVREGIPVRIESNR